MKDYKAALEKLRKEAAEARLIAGLATDKSKRVTFERLAVHLDALADGMERAMQSAKP